MDHLAAETVADLTRHLQAFEQELLQPAVRHDEARLCELLASKFREFGSSGRVYTRDAIVVALQAESSGQLALSEFAAEPLGEAAALVTYRVIKTADGVRSSSLRSSVWVRRDGRWQMLFHQGTRCEA